MTEALDRAVPAQGREHAEIYEVVHSARGRDWVAEADLVAKLVLARNPWAGSLLDVACGTGAHLRRFGSRFARVAGVELSPAMRGIAEARLPGVPVHAGDVRGFDLGVRFDAVTCLRFAIAHARSLAELGTVAECFARHLVHGGVLVVEPWWFPERFPEGCVSGSVVERDGVVVSRLSHSVRRGRTTSTTVRYTVAEASGIRDFTEREELGLFGEEEYLAAFAAAGISAAHVPGGLNGRGVFVGVRC
ncbi:class I SAM-dependent methyltransferase [Actinosynnema pretiosum subsp. pretiosum]|uniref:Methyltransferase type 11 n=2 Tax=Actinosynnema TaxID=40566 RepID=C6WK00_ACTMD|nr:class I SAM-dependent methyltransferase [Actinosynnema mirum]ACU38213.1 Methyltransferase type 11 [Actinosynnema mirum DSM 43827]AXX31723.1 Methyltransferase type 12 [Actinosynnema pretiosum subsp. pretiosum]QUF04266.1 class I SAM-dependent methyltransferase [Actinosynnema pretiosum subsp. pretiosum]